jgi:AsmA family protein
MRWRWILAIAAAVVMGGLIVIYIILASYDFNKLKPQITELAKEYTGRDLTLAGDIKLGIGLSPDLKVENVSFQNAAWGSRPELAKIERLEIQLELIPLISGDIQVKRLTLLKPDMLIEIDKSGKSNLAFDLPEKKESKAEIEESEEKIPLNFSFNEISINDGNIVLSDHQAGSKHMIRLDQFDLQAPEFGAPADMMFKGAYNDIPIQASGKLGPLSGILDPVEAWPFELKVQTLESNIEIAGKFQDPMGVKGIDVKLSAAGPAIGNFGKITGDPLPIQGPYKFSGQLVTQDLNVIKLDNFSFVLGTDSISGTAAVNLSSEKPDITANLSADHLDLRPVLAQQEQKSSTTEQKPTKETKKPEKVFPATPLPLDDLHAANAAIDLEIKQLLLPKNAMNNLKTKVSLKNGHLTIKPFLADIGGGKLAVELDLKTKEKTATIEAKVDADQVDLGKMLRELEITEALDGLLDFDINLKGRGNSIAAIMAGLNGDVIAVIGEGRIPVHYLNLVGADFQTSMLKLLNPLQEKEEVAKVNCLVSDFHIKDGVANNDIMLIDTPRMTIIGVGQINLKTEKLDFGIKPQPKEGLGTKETGKLSISLSEFTNLFRLSGTLAKPTLGISSEETLKTVGKTGFAVLTGPVGIAKLFISGSSGSENPCATALEIAAKGPAASKREADKKKDTKKSVEKKTKGVSNKILDIFKKKQ